MKNRTINEILEIRDRAKLAIAQCDAALKEIFAPLMKEIQPSLVTRHTLWLETISVIPNSGVHVHYSYEVPQPYGPPKGFGGMYVFPEEMAKVVNPTEFGQKHLDSKKEQARLTLLEEKRTKMEKEIREVQNEIDTIKNGGAQYLMPPHNWSGA